MDELLALIAALFEAFNKRERPDRPAAGTGLGRALRDAFAERAAAPGQAAAPTRPPVGLPPGAAAQPPAPAFSGNDAASPRRAPPAAQPPEAGRVTALFANPQSLVAAFIVAEVLAKPVALRDAHGGVTESAR
jgi:hypothetical protein